MTTATLARTNGHAPSLTTAHGTEFSSEQTDLLARTIAKGATPDELAGMVAACERVGKGPTARFTIPRRVLDRLYTELGLSTLEVGRILGCSKKTVRLRLIGCGIAVRSPREAFAISATHHGNNPTTGEQCSWWKGGRKAHTGYVQVMTKDHPEANACGYVFEHRLVAEEMLGRRLRPGEEVHHINENRADNRPENLQVMTKSAHMALHMRQRHASGRMRAAAGGVR